MFELKSSIHSYITNIIYLIDNTVVCFPQLITIADDFCGLDMNAPLGVSEMVRGYPVFTEDRDRMTSVIAYVYKNHSLAFVGTKSGKLKKVGTWWTLQHFPVSFCIVLFYSRNTVYQYIFPVFYLWFEW